MKLSAALCTYNGEQFIDEQLSSIINQTRKVDEIVVCDDCSTDGTIDIIRRIARNNPEVDIRIIVNDHNLGVCANFEKAVNECSGDIIFLSDQDDVWVPDKVEAIIDWFEKNPEKSVVFTDADLIDINGIPLGDGKSLWYYTGFSEKTQKQFCEGYAFEIIASHNRCTGSTMAFRKDFVFGFSRYCNSKILHDDIIAVAAVVNDKLGFITKKLIRYRVHNGQTMGIYMHGKPNCSIYSVNSKSEYYCDLTMPQQMRDRLNLFVLRASIPKVALMKINRYISIYGIVGFLFWWSDFKRLASQVLKLNENK